MRLSELIGIGTLALVLSAGCGDDTSGGTKDTRDGDADVSFGDAIPGDTQTSDTALADTALPDSMVADTAGDAAVGDTSVADTTVADTSVADTTVADTAVADTTVADTTASHPCSGAPASHTRHVVLSYPYAANGSHANTWKAFPMTADGDLGAATATFTMGRAVWGVVAFSPDGSLGFAAQEDGTLGVFAMGGAGQPTVVSAGADPGVYLDGVVVDGDRLLLVNPNWAESGGGIYAAPYDCDGTIGTATLLYGSKNASYVLPRGADQLVTSRAAGDTSFGHLHLMRETGGTWSKIAGADLFGHDTAQLSALAVTVDGRFALVGQNSEFSTEPNVIGVAALGADTVTAGAPVSFNDPVALAVSPHEDVVLAVSGYGNTVRVLSYDPTGVTPFADVGAPTYVTQAPQLPGDAVIVGGDHPDLVLVIENLAVRRFRFDGGGVVTDLGRAAYAGEGYEHIPGALGVQP